MRLEATAARTWLLGIFAGLAVLVYGAALLGLGGRLGPPTAVAELPAPGPVAHLPDAPSERLGQIDQYAAIAVRSLFSSDRSPQEFRLVAEAQPAQAVDVRLTGVLITPRLRMATLQTSSGDSLRLRQGAADVSGWRLVSVEPRSATVEGPGGTRNLELQTELGSQQIGIPGTPSVPSPGTEATRPARHAEPAVGGAINATATASASTTAPPPADTTQERIEAIRQQIEARRRQLQQGQGSAPESNP